VWLKNKKIGTVCIIIAGLIAFSRLYLHVHFPSDVLVGIAIGILSAISANLIIEKSQFS